MQGVVPRPDIGPKLQEHFVGLASDADDAEPAVMALAGELEDAMMLPFVIFADAAGKFVGGYAGVVTPPYLLKMLDEVIAKKAAR